MHSVSTTNKLSALQIAEAMLREVKAKGRVKAYRDGFMIYCPGHNNVDEPSAWIADNSSDPVDLPPALKCWTGCARETMIAGLRARGLWGWDKKKAKPKHKREDLVAEFVKTWYYDDIDPITDDDVKVGRVTRMNLKVPETGEFVKKTFGTKKITKSGEWIDAGPGFHFPIFNKRKVRDHAKKGKIIFSVEGEKKCDIMESKGFTAFTTKNGASNEPGFIAAKPEESLTGCKYVVVIPDNDQPGMKCALFKCRHLHNKNIPVKFLVLPGLGAIVDSKGHGLDDWFYQFGHNEDELKQLVTDAPFWSPDPGDDAVEDPAIEPESEETEEAKEEEGGEVVGINQLPGEDKNVFSEQALSWAFKRMFEHTAKFVPGVGWFIWNDKVWELDEAGKVRDLLSVVVERKKKEFYRKGLDQTKITQWYEKFGNLKPQTSVITMAQNKCKASMLEFDTDPFLLNCLNGMIDLRTGERLDHDKNKLCTKIVKIKYEGVDYNNCPRWEKFLSESVVLKEPVVTEADGERKLTWLPDVQTIGALARAMGYSLTGDVSEKKFFLLLGKKHAGKSKIGERIQRLLGKKQYAKAASKRVFLLLQQENKYSDFVNVAFARAVVFDEVGGKDVIDDEKLKSITGGDELTCSYAHKDTFNVPSTAKLWVYGNDRPKVHANGNEATWTRIVVFPFYRTFEEHEQDKEMDIALDKEASGILSWAVRGCLEWQALKGIHPSPAMLAAKREYQQEMDEMEPFIKTYCETGEGDLFYISCEEYFEHHHQWQKHKLKMKMPWSSNRVGREMTGKGYKRAIKDGKTCYVGIRVKPDKAWELSSNSGSGSRYVKEGKED